MLLSRLMRWSALGLVLCAPSGPRALDVARRCELQALALQSPPHFPALGDAARHRSSELGRALGRRLFFDPRLSRDGQVACASCHEPRYAFSNPESLATRGVTGRAGLRHTPSLLNVAWAETGLFWDGGAKNLESQALAPLLHADELGRKETLPELLATLQADPQYVACFAAVFEPPALTLGHVMQVLAQYERSLVVADARWDLARLGFLSLEPAERRGEDVFARECARCHPPPLFTDHDFHNNGLDGAFPAHSSDERRGRARISRRPQDLGKYKTPSLRRVFDSAPYMHDGRFWSVAQVLEHYRHGIRPSDTLDVGLVQATGELGVRLDAGEVADLTAFLNALR